MSEKTLLCCVKSHSVLFRHYRRGRELRQEAVPRHFSAGPLGREEREPRLATVTRSCRHMGSLDICERYLTEPGNGHFPYQGAVPGLTPTFPTRSTWPQARRGQVNAGWYKNDRSCRRYANMNGRTTLEASVIVPFLCLHAVRDLMTLINVNLRTFVYIVVRPFSFFYRTTHTASTVALS